MASSNFPFTFEYSLSRFRASSSSIYGQYFRPSSFLRTSNARSNISQLTGVFSCSFNRFCAVSKIFSRKRFTWLAFRGSVFWITNLAMVSHPMRLNFSSRIVVAAILFFFTSSGEPSLSGLVNTRIILGNCELWGRFFSPSLLHGLKLRRAAAHRITKSKFVSFKGLPMICSNFVPLWTNFGCASS